MGDFKINNTWNAVEWCLLRFLILFSAFGVIAVGGTVTSELPKQTAALEQIAINTKQTVTISLQDVSPEAVKVLENALKPAPVAGKKGRK